MTQLGQSVQPPTPFAPRLEWRHSGLTGGIDLGLVDFEYGTGRPQVDLERVTGPVHQGGLMSLGATPGGISLQQRTAYSVLKSGEFGARLATPVFANFAVYATGTEQSNSPQSISEQATLFARKHGLMGSLVVLKNEIIRDDRLVSAVSVDLGSDPEVTNQFTICFRVRTAGRLKDVLDFDERVNTFLYESIPVRDQIHFAVLFDFA